MLPNAPLSGTLATFRRKIGWRWLLDRIDWFAENCKIGRIGLTLVAAIDSFL